MFFDTGENEGDGKLVFVYGTLKTGQPNRARLGEYMGSDICVVGNAVTKYPYPLVLATEYNVPFMINEICYTAKRVSGELLRVSSRALAFLDYIESVPTLYCRERIEVDLLEQPRPWPAPGRKLETAGEDEASTTGTTREASAAPAAEAKPEGSAAAPDRAAWCWCYFLAHHNPRVVVPPFYSEYDSAKMPLLIDVDSLTPQQEEKIKLGIAKQAQIAP